MLVGAMLGAGAGAVLRYWLSTLRRGAFPWPTIIANALGTALLGGALAAVDADALGPVGMAIVGAGIAGGLTTFSSLAVDALALWRDSRAAATAYLGVTWVLGLVAGVAGWSAVGAVLTM